MWWDQYLVNGMCNVKIQITGWRQVTTKQFSLCLLDTKSCIATNRYLPASTAILNQTLSDARLIKMSRQRIKAPSLLVEDDSQTSWQVASQQGGRSGATWPAGPLFIAGKEFRTALVTWSFFENEMTFLSNCSAWNKGKQACHSHIHTHRHLLALWRIKELWLHARHVLLGNKRLTSWLQQAAF